jgi:hypothetical protein
MNSHKARERAEKSFKKEERAQDGRKAMFEYESQAPRATREKTARRTDFIELRSADGQVLFRHLRRNLGRLWLSASPRAPTHPGA